MAKDISTESRAAALKLAYDALIPKIFTTRRQTELSDINELFELAEYNDRFINSKDLEIQYKSANEKIRDTIRETAKSR